MKHEMAPYSWSSVIHAPKSWEIPNWFEKMSKDENFAVAANLDTLVHTPSDMGAQARQCVMSVIIGFSSQFGDFWASRVWSHLMFVRLFS